MCFGSTESGRRRHAHAAQAAHLPQLRRRVAQFGGVRNSEREREGERERERERIFTDTNVVLLFFARLSVGQTALALVRHTASQAGDQIVPSFFCLSSFVPLRHPVSFCGSVTKTIWASGERSEERDGGREREGPFLPPCAAIKLNCRSGGGGFFL